MSGFIDLPKAALTDLAQILKIGVKFIFLFGGCVLEKILLLLKLLLKLFPWILGFKLFNFAAHLLLGERKDVRHRRVELRTGFMASFTRRTLKRRPLQTFS